MIEPVDLENAEWCILRVECQHIHNIGREDTVSVITRRKALPIE
jgi:hypothetical protein